MTKAIREEIKISRYIKEINEKENHSQVSTLENWVDGGSKVNIRREEH